jgi:hypothetical protein
MSKDISSGEEHWRMYERLKIEDSQAAGAYWRSNKESMIAYGRRLMAEGYMGLFSQKKVKTASSIQAEIFEKDLECLRMENESLKSRIEDLNNQLLSKDKSVSISEEQITKRVNMLVMEKLASVGVHPIKISRQDTNIPKSRTDLIETLKAKLKEGH